MKKIISFLLAAVLLVSAVPMAHAAETTDYTNGTAVVYTATNTEAYTVTVPALLAPGGSGTVTLSGTWPSDKKISVTADKTVTLTNSINADDTKTLDVTFAGMAYTGDNTQARTYTETISVADISNALFGTWSGHCYYNVTSETVVVPGATFLDGTFLTWEELQLAENGTTYGYNASAITDASIGNRAFYGCSNLTSVEIPDSVTSISSDAFYDCTNLTSIEIPDSVTSIGDYAFESCHNLTSVTIGDGVTSMGTDVFSSCRNLTSVTIGDGVTSIGNKAFYQCSSLTSVEIPDSVTIIGNSAFGSCTNLISVTIGDGVTSIGNGAFGSCTNLTSIEIPDSVTNIGIQTFYGCTDLREINFTGTVEQWNAIIFGSSWHVNVPATEVTCSDGTVSLS